MSGEGRCIGVSRWGIAASMPIVSHGTWNGCREDGGRIIIEYSDGIGSALLSSLPNQLHSH